MRADQLAVRLSLQRRVFRPVDKHSASSVLVTAAPAAGLEARTVNVAVDTDTTLCATTVDRHVATVGNAVHGFRW